MATAEIIVSESLSRNQKAIQRTNERRAHAQGLRAQIQYVRDEYRLAKKILNESYHDDLDQIATDYPQRDEAPVRPARHHGKAPTPYALYCYLSAHAEWESRSGQALRRMLQDNHEKDLQDLLADALAQIAVATEQAINRVPKSMKALRRDLRRIGAESCEKLHPHADTPLVGSGMLNDYGLEARLAYARSIRTLDGGRPRLTAPDSDIPFDEGSESLTTRHNGRQVATSAPAAAAREITFQH